MSNGCNASIVVGPGRITCAWNCEHDVEHTMHRDDMARPHLHWSDLAPSAEPHEEPPRYYASKVASGWVVKDRQNAVVPPASFYGIGPAPHPDPEGSARAEAARLNAHGI
jgi:hypothetical protein